MHLHRHGIKMHFLYLIQEACWILMFIRCFICSMQFKNGQNMFNNWRAWFSLMYLHHLIRAGRRGGCCGLMVGRLVVVVVVGPAPVCLATAKGLVESAEAHRHKVAPGVLRSVAKGRRWKTHTAGMWVHVMTSEKWHVTPWRMPRSCLIRSVHLQDVQDVLSSTTLNTHFRWHCSRVCL